MDEIFRRIFGFGGPRINRPHFGDENDGDDDPEEFSSFFGGDRNDPFGESFFHFNDQIQRQMEAMEGLMQEMFKNFGATEFPSIEFEPHQERPSTTNPRDRMLRGPEPGDPDQGSNRDIMPIQPPIQPPLLGPVPRFGRFPRLPQGGSEDKKDTDLDGLIQGKEDNIGKLFGEDRLAPQVPGPQVPESPRSWSSGFSKSFSRTFRNGRVEEVETIRHSDGSSEKIVRHKEGDKTHTTIYKTDKHGHTEESESIQNMDEKDLPLFDKGRLPRRPPMIRDPQSEPSASDISRDDKSFFKNLFGFDFWKPKS